MTQPPHTTPVKTFLPILAEALQSELHALESLARRMTLFSGERVGTFADRHYYRFEIPEHVVLSWLTNVECRIGTLQPMVVHAALVAVDAQFLTLAFPLDFGPVLPEVSCSWDYRPVMQSAVSSLTESPADGSLTERLLDPGSGNNHHAISFEPAVLPDTPEDQRTALTKIFRNRVSFVWGPVRSGKTHLLSHCAANYLKAGKSVLFVTTRNDRVDDVLLRSIEVGQKLDVDMPAWTCCVGLPAIENFEKLGSISLERQITEERAKKRRSFQERVSLLETFRTVRIKQILHEDAMGRIAGLRERLSERKKQLDQLNSEMLPLKESINRIQNASMMDRLKKGFGKEDLARVQRKLEEKQASAKRLQSHLTTLTQESLRKEAHAPISGEEQQRFNLAMKRIEELGGLAKVEEAVEQYTAVDEKSFLGSKRFVGSTLVSALSDERLAGRTFDLLMVDDAESIPLPLLTALARLAKEKMVVCGDPYQLGPESASTSAQSWFRRDIFLHTARTERLHTLFEYSEKHSEWFLLLSSHFATTPKLSLFTGSVLFDEKINVFASPQAKGRIFFIDTTSLRSKATQYLGRKKILPHNELHTKKMLELVKHALMEPGRLATDCGVIVPLAGPSLYIKQQLRMEGIGNIEVGLPESFRGRRRKAIIVDTVMAGVDHTVRPIDDMKVGEHQIVRLFNTALSTVDEDLYVLADMGHFQSLYKDRLFTRLLMLLKAQSDPLVNFALAAKAFDELEWDQRIKLISYSGEALSGIKPKKTAKALEEDAEFAVQMKLMAKKEGVKVEGSQNHEMETYRSVIRILGQMTDNNLIAELVGGEILFHRSLATESAMAKLPFSVCLSEREFQSAMEDWNLLVYEMSGGGKSESALLKGAPEAKVRGDINALNSFYSADVETAVEEGKQKLAVAVAKVFQEGLGKAQPGNPQEWVTAYLKFLAKLGTYLSWISAQLRK